MKNKYLLFLLPSLLLSSCTISSNNTQITYLNCHYVLKSAGDLHGLNVWSNEVLDRNPGFTNYTNLFDISNSFIDFQLLGDSFESLHCDSIFQLKSKPSSFVEEINIHEEFQSRYGGKQSDNIIFLSDEAKLKLGSIHVYTPHRLIISYIFTKINRKLSVKTRLFPI